jgi:hypothetical protein
MADLRELIGILAQLMKQADHRVNHTWDPRCQACMWEGRPR